MGIINTFIRITKRWILMISYDVLELIFFVDLIFYLDTYVYEYN